MTNSEKRDLFGLIGLLAALIGLSAAKEWRVPSAEGRPSRYRGENEGSVAVDELVKSLEQRRNRQSAGTH